jgi:LysR family transcriptional regulator for metE and metH
VEACLEAAGVRPTVGMELGSNEAIKRAVEAGMGVAFVGARVAEREAAEHRVRTLRVQADGLALCFFVVHHRDRAHAPVLRAFLDVALRARGRRA